AYSTIPAPPSALGSSTSSTPSGASSSRSASTRSDSARLTRNARRIMRTPRRLEDRSRGVVAQHPAQLGQHRLVRAQIFLGEGLAQLIEQLALLGAETSRNYDVDHNAQAAATAATQ